MNKGCPPVLPSFGPRFENTVDYIAFDRDGLLERYGDRASFLSAVDRADFDVVAVGRRRPEGLEAIDEARWLESAGWHVVEVSERFRLFGPA